MPSTVRSGLAATAALTLATAASKSALASVTAGAAMSAPSLAARAEKFSMICSRLRLSISMAMVGETASTLACRSSGRYQSSSFTNIRSISTCGFMAANFSTSNCP